LRGETIGKLRVSLGRGDGWKVKPVMGCVRFRELSNGFMTLGEVSIIGVLGAGERVGRCRARESVEVLLYSFSHGSAIEDARGDEATFDEMRAGIASIQSPGRATGEGEGGSVATSCAWESWSRLENLCL
jgi:hypothetical protein